MKFIKEIFSNPDGTFSTKRFIGIGSFFVAVFTSFYTLHNTQDTTIILGIPSLFLGFSTTVLGLSSVDLRRTTQPPSGD